MVKKSHLLLSLLLPFFVTVIVPLFLLKVIANQLYFNPNLILFFLGIILLALSLVLFIKCNLVFYKIGKGTLLDLEKLKTQKMVFVGPYKYVRNPMIISVILILVSESFIFGSLSILTWAIIFFITNLFYFPLFEEKGLEKRFGEEYLHYKKNVRAWIPNFKPYERSTKN